jgi:hypothetical protein
MAPPVVVVGDRVAHDDALAADADAATVEVLIGALVRA